jgi:hypothetical protein
MAIQIIVSFGHAHRIESFRQGALLPQATAGIHDLSTVEPSDPGSKPIGLPFEYCAICVVIKMGASAMPAEVPASNVPLNVSRIRFSPRADAVTPTPGHLLFQARAPPSA